MKIMIENEGLRSFSKAGAGRPQRMRSTGGVMPAFSSDFQQG